MTKTTKGRSDVYTMVTERILDLLDRGTVPWKQGWKPADQPRNAVTGRPYRGSNLFGLACIQVFNGYSSPFWLTFKQAKQLGGSVKKGERSTVIVFWKVVDKRSDSVEDEKRKRYLVARYYRVFNLAQTEGVELPKGRLKEVEGYQHDPSAAHTEAHKVFRNYVDREGVKLEVAEPAYNPRTDAIRLPLVERFVSLGDYFSAAFHEATHSTGHESRLNRPGIASYDYFGSHKYSDEELVAEFGSTLLTSVLGVATDETVECSAAYIDEWRKRLSDDPKLAIHAAQRAQVAADFILGKESADDSQD